MNWVRNLKFLLSYILLNLVTADVAAVIMRCTSAAQLPSLEMVAPRYLSLLKPYSVYSDLFFNNNNGPR